MKRLFFLAIVSCSMHAWHTLDYDPCDIAGINKRMRDKIDRDYPPIQVPKRTHTIIDYDNYGNMWANGNDGYRGQGHWENNSFHYYEY